MSPPFFIEGPWSPGLPNLDKGVHSFESVSLGDLARASCLECCLAPAQFVALPLFRFSSADKLG